MDAKTTGKETLSHLHVHQGDGKNRNAATKQMQQQHGAGRVAGRRERIFQREQVLVRASYSSYVAGGSTCFSATSARWRPMPQCIRRWSIWSAGHVSERSREVLAVVGGGCACHRRGRRFLCRHPSQLRAPPHCLRCFFSCLVVGSRHALPASHLPPEAEELQVVDEREAQQLQQVEGGEEAEQLEEGEAQQLQQVEGWGRQSSCSRRRSCRRSTSTS